MCKECGNDITLHVENILNNTNDADKIEKFMKAVDVLANITGIPSTLSLDPPKEEFPQMTEDLIAIYLREYRKILNGLLKQLGIIFEGAPVSLFKAKSDGFPKGIYNPKTGEPLTQREWRQIERAVDSYLDIRTEDLAEKMAMKSSSLGAVINNMDNANKEIEKVPLADVKSKLPTKLTFKEVTKKYGWSKEYSRPIVFRTDNIANYVTGINDSVRKDVKKVLVDGLSNQKTPREVADDLFNRFESWNKDWERIARTEIQNSVNDGILVTEQSEAIEGEEIYMIGAGSAGACPICQRDIINKVVKLLPKPLAGGGEKIDDPYTDTAIWAGKNSIGYGAKQSYAVITRHPHCYDDKTEVLTNNGWKLFSKLNKKDKIYAMDYYNEVMDFVNFSKIQKIEYSGHLFKFKGEYHDLLVTPDHMMLYSNTIDGNVLPATAKELREKNEFYIPVPINGEYNEIKLSKNIKVTKKHYDGFVHDVTLDKWSFLLVRRNGKMSWSGNCACRWVRYYPEEVATPPKEEPSLKPIKLGGNI